MLITGIRRLFRQSCDFQHCSDLGKVSEQGLVMMALPLVELELDVFMSEPRAQVITGYELKQRCYPQMHLGTEKLAKAPQGWIPASGAATFPGKTGAGKAPFGM